MTPRSTRGGMTPVATPMRDEMGINAVGGMSAEEALRAGSVPSIIRLFVAFICLFICVCLFVFFLPLLPSLMFTELHRYLSISTNVKSVSSVIYA